ncbi:hypothetical protein ABFY59_28465 [Priestia aryabhattai]|uniref:hypothetical protein n=1 Tax=Priestia TaxID=2800373 RepID=UPI0015CF73C9|nr:MULTISPECIES: hypothetical protein [Priestia]MBU3570038.1 hypothetical protein [Priestia aryabhattai]WDL87835.1 hypothetical protein IUJ58_02810 [Priestia aryabhattai]
MKKDYIVGFLVMLVVIKLTDNLNILDSWLLTHLVRLTLGFITLFIVSVILKKVLQKEK